VGALVPDSTNDSARHAAHHVRPVTELPDFAQHRSLVLPGDVRFEDNDHKFILKLAGSTKKPQELSCGTGLNLRMSTALASRFTGQKSIGPQTES
jgi:hypothetical protein